MKRTPLKRTAALRRRRKPALAAEDMAARSAWKDPKAGWCGCGCDPRTFAPHLERHHVVSASKLREVNRLDVMWVHERNSMLLCPRHHAWHTDHFKLIRIEFVPMVALRFADEVLGEGPAAAYFEAHYDCTVLA